MTNLRWPLLTLLSTHYYYYHRHNINLIMQNKKSVEIKQTEEVRKIEYSVQIETKLTTAEQKREEELKKKLDAAKKHVNNFIRC